MICDGCVDVKPAWRLNTECALSSVIYQTKCGFIPFIPIYSFRIFPQEGCWLRGGGGGGGGEVAHHLNSHCTLITCNIGIRRTLPVLMCSAVCIQMFTFYIEGVLLTLLSKATHNLSFTHRRRSQPRRATSQFIRSSHGEGVSPRDTSGIKLATFRLPVNSRYRYTAIYTEL